MVSVRNVTNLMLSVRGSAVLNADNFVIDSAMTENLQILLSEQGEFSCIHFDNASDFDSVSLVLMDDSKMESVLFATNEAVTFYVPFRAIANDQLENLLFAGKNIAQSFYADAATRLHPSEWNTGVAAGATAWVMVHRPRRRERETCL